MAVLTVAQGYLSNWRLTISALDFASTVSAGRAARRAVSAESLRNMVAGASAAGEGSARALLRRSMGAGRRGAGAR